MSLVLFAERAREAEVVVKVETRRNKPHLGSMSSPAQRTALPREYKSPHLMVSLGVTTNAASVIPAPNPAIIIPVLVGFPLGPETSR